MFYLLFIDDFSVCYIRFVFIIYFNFCKDYCYEIEVLDFFIVEVLISYKLNELLMKISKIRLIK